MLFEHTKADINFILENDPAARSKVEVFLLYPSVHCLMMYRVSHFFYKKNPILVKDIPLQAALILLEQYLSWQDFLQELKFIQALL